MQEEMPTETVDYQQVYTSSLHPVNQTITTVSFGAVADIIRQIFL